MTRERRWQSLSAKRAAMIGRLARADREHKRKASAAIRHDLVWITQKQIKAELALERA